MLRHGVPPVYARVVAPFRFAPRSHTLASAGTADGHALRHQVHACSSARGVSQVDGEARLPLSCHGAWGPVTNTRPWRGSARGERRPWRIRRASRGRNFPNPAAAGAPAITGITRATTDITRVTDLSPQ